MYTKVIHRKGVTVWDRTDKEVFTGGGIDKNR